MKIIDTSEVKPDDLSQWERDQVYNGMDCCLTREVFDAIFPQLDNHTTATYAFSRELQAPLLEMRLRGVLIDTARKEEVIEEYFTSLDKLENQLEKIVGDGCGFWGFNWRSNSDLKHLFYNVLGIPPVVRKGSETVNRDALEKIENYFQASQIVLHLKAMRDLQKKISMLKTEIDPDDRMRTSYNIAGTNTGRLSSSFSEFGTGCVLPTAEALTRHGWKQIQYIQDDEEIAQYNQGLIEFVPCKMHCEHHTGDIYRFNSTQTDLCITPGHRVMWWDVYSGWKVDRARTIAYHRQIRIPLGGFIQGNLGMPSWLPMLMADFSKEGKGYWRGEFTKKRKIQRFLEIAELYGLDYEELNAREFYRRFSVRAPDTLPKKWGPWVLELTANSAEELIEEARYWDAHDRGSGYIFYTADKEQAEWFATLAHLAGRSATIRQMEQGPKSYSTTTMWCVNVKNRDYAQVLSKHWSTESYDGPVFCPQVPSSFWLVREKGKISVTGNTNLQNIEESLRSVFIADPGYKLAYIDAEQGESRVVGAIEWNLFQDGRYLDTCESGDLHTRVAKLCWPRLNWPGDPDGDRKLAEKPYYRHYDRRFMCKKIGHGTNYGGKPDTLANQAKIEVGVIKEFQPIYFKAFPAHLRWHENVDYQLRNDGYLVSLTGRKRWFFGRRNDPATLREAIAYDPQGSLADILNRGMLQVWRDRHGAVQILLQIHDAILIQYREELEDRILPQVLESLRYSILLEKDREFIIPYAIKTGWNWGTWNEETNPDGLKAWKGGDKRKRTPATPLLDRVVRRVRGTDKPRVSGDLSKVGGDRSTGSSA